MSDDIPPIAHLRERLEACVTTSPTRTPAVSPRMLKRRALRDVREEQTPPMTPSSRTPNLIVDGILSTSVDTMLVYMCADTLAKGFHGVGVTKVLTVETAGISIGFPLAMCLGVNMVYARKKRMFCERLLEMPYRRKTASTEGCLFLAGEFFAPGDRILVCDSFLATGHTLTALILLAAAVGAEVVGVAVMIEKVWKAGRERLAEQGVARVDSLLRILSMDTVSGVVFDDTRESTMAADVLRASIIERAAMSEGWGLD